MNALSCKFLYQPPPAGPGWDKDFYRAIGLETLLENDFARIGVLSYYILYFHILNYRVAKLILSSLMYSSGPS